MSQNLNLKFRIRKYTLSTLESDQTKNGIQIKYIDSDPFSNNCSRSIYVLLGILATLVQNVTRVSVLGDFCFGRENWDWVGKKECQAHLREYSLYRKGSPSLHTIWA